MGIYDFSARGEIRTFADRHNFNYHEDSSGIYVRASRMEDLIGTGVPALQLRPANLEDVFLKLTGKELSTDA